MLKPEEASVGAEPPTQVTGTDDHVTVLAPAEIIKVMLSPAAQVPAVGVLAPERVQV